MLFRSTKDNITIKNGIGDDFIVLEKSIFEDNYNNLKNIKVLKTFVGGKNIFSTL